MCMLKQLNKNEKNTTSKIKEKIQLPKNKYKKNTTTKKERTKKELEKGE